MLEGTARREQNSKVVGGADRANGGTGGVRAAVCGAAQKVDAVVCVSVLIKGDMDLLLAYSDHRRSRRASYGPAVHSQYPNGVRRAHVLC